MAFKTIYVAEGGSEVSAAQLFDNGDYRELLTRNGIECLANAAGVQIFGYAGLEDHGKYEPVKAKEAKARRLCFVLGKGFAQGELPSIWRTRDPGPWERDSRATTYINELLQAPQTQVGSLVVIEMKTTLQQDEQRTTSTLVIPSGTRGCWNELLDHTKEEVAGQRYVVIGTPGVGKSRSLNYLIREIIFKHRTKGSLPPAIVFEHRKDRLVWLFVPYERENPQSEYEAFSMRLMLFDPPGTAVLFDMRNYYIIESEKERTERAPALVPAKTIYPAGSDRIHGFSDQLRKGGTYYIPVWKEQEIFDAIPHMIGADQKQALLDSSPHQSLEEIVQQRMGEVGAIPRRVFSDPPDYEVFKKRLKTAMDRSRTEVARDIGTGHFGLDAVRVIDVKDTQKPTYTLHVDRFVSSNVHSRVSLDTAQALHDRVVRTTHGNTTKGKWTSAERDYREIIAQMLAQNGFQGKMKEMGVPNPKTVELTIEPGGAWMRAVKAPFLGMCDKFTTAVKVQTTGATPVIAESNVPAINLLDRFNLDRDEKRQVNVAAVQRLLKEPGLKEEDMHIVQLVPEGMEPSLSTQGNVRVYRATLPLPRNWKPFFHRGFSTLRRLARVL